MTTIPEIHGESRGLLSFVVPYPDIVAGGTEGRPGDVEPAGAGEELVGQGVMAEEIDQTLEMLRVLGADVGSLAQEVLGTSDTTD